MRTAPETSPKRAESNLSKTGLDLTDSVKWGQHFLPVLVTNTIYINSADFKP